MSVKIFVKLAVGAATALPVASWALAPAAVNSLPAADVIYISGTTITDAAFQARAKLDPTLDGNAPFQAGTYDLYKTATGFVLTGKVGPIFGSALPVGTSIAIIKQTEAGLGIGIHDVAAVDGVAPTIWNVQRGTYTWLMEDTVNYSEASLARNGATSPGAILNVLAVSLADPAVLVGLNKASQNAAAIADLTGAADTGLVTRFTPTNLWGNFPPWTAGPSVSAGWPAAIRAFN